MALVYKNRELDLQLLDRIDMRRLFAILALTAAVTAHGAETVTLFDGRLTFTLPDGFAIMPPKLKKLKYPNANRPKYIYSNTKTTTSIAVNTMEARLTDSQLPDFRNFIEKSMKRMVPGCRILKRDLINLNGTRWAKLELKSNAIDTDIHNILLMAALDGQPVMFNFNATNDEYPRIKKALEKGINTIRINKKPSNQVLSRSQ